MWPASKGTDLDVDNLYVKTALANEGPRMKRIRPAPMGRAFRYQRRLTHIVLTVAERAVASGLVTKVEESAVAPKAAKAKTEAPKPEHGAAKTAKPAKAKKATETKAEEPQAAPKATKKKASKKA